MTPQQSPFLARSEADAAARADSFAAESKALAGNAHYLHCLTQSFTAATVRPRPEDLAAVREANQLILEAADRLRNA